MMILKSASGPQLLVIALSLLVSGCVSLKEKHQDLGPVTPKEVSYQCADNYRFVLSYGAFQIGENSIKLQDDQIMYSDYQHFIASSLFKTRKREPVKYANSSIKLQLSGDRADIKLRDHSLKYKDCTLVNE